MSVNRERFICRYDHNLRDLNFVAHVITIITFEKIFVAKYLLPSLHFSILSMKEFQSKVFFSHVWTMKEVLSYLWWYMYFESNPCLHWKFLTNGWHKLNIRCCDVRPTGWPIDRPADQSFWRRPLSPTITSAYNLTLLLTDQMQLIQQQEYCETSIVVAAFCSAATSSLLCTAACLNLFEE